MTEEKSQLHSPGENGGTEYGAHVYGPDSEQLFSLRTGNTRTSNMQNIAGSNGTLSTSESDARSIASSGSGNGILGFFQRVCCRRDEASEELLNNQPQRGRRTLSTFTGVMAPVAMSMFSTVLFMRAGFLVGQAGLLEAILQLVLSYTILLLTVLSICAISTNGAVEGGGAYYMISRALGPEFGGSIGFVFYIANVLSCALYVSGVVEGIVSNFGVGSSIMADGNGLPVGEHTWWNYLYASCVLFVCLIVCLVGGSMFAKTSAAILFVTVICLLSVYISIFAQNHVIQVAIPKENQEVYTNQSMLNMTIKYNYTGLKAQTFSENLYPVFTKDYSTKNLMTFATVFAVLFSSVTGIMNGANMSGELKDPSKSIPKGTLAAVAFTFVSYMIEIILIAGSCQRKLLINNYVFLPEVNLWKPFVLIGIFATTLSAALGNLIGASRILEALAQDQLFWIFLKPATITTRGGNPIVSVLITWILVQLILMVGSLNAIAPVTSVFFLMSYASTNLACMALDLASAPNFRPTFKFFSWQTSFLGLIGCMVMCFLISPLFSSIAIILMLVLIILLHFRSLPTEWGQISQALIFHQVRKYLLMLDIRKSHVKYWRPQILLMVSNPRQCCELMEFVNDIKKGGLYVIGHVKLGSLDEYPDKDPLAKDYPKWLKLVEILRLKAFVELVLTPTVSDGLHHLIRLSGLGGMKVNTVCLGFYDDCTPLDTLARRRVQKRKFFKMVDQEGHIEVGEIFRRVRDPSTPRDITEEEYVKLVTDALKLQKNVCLFRHFNQLDKVAVMSSKGTLYIDVWPVNFFRPETSSYFDNTCLFLLQMACIINMVPGWKSKTCLRVFLFVNAQTENTSQKEQKLEAFLRQLRIIAKIQIVSWESIASALEREFDMSINYAESRMQEFNETSSEFLTAVNRLIKSFSSRTQVTFLYLPRPPHEKSLHKTYLQQIQGLTEGLPPTVLVHGLHPVTSTTL